MTKPMAFISLFAGIGGMDLGLGRAGMQCVAQVEIDDYASKILAKHWPDVARFRDVRTVGAHNLPACDLICGGFPCQDISNAGKHAGITGERSGLWREFARIIGELRPRYALIENVSALLGRGLGAVLCDLAALGYDAEWHCIPAAAVGAPHIRDRVFILAYAASVRRDKHQTIIRSIGTRKEKGRLCESTGGRDRWTGQPQPGVGRMADGVPRRVDRLRGLGNAVVPQVAEYIGRMIMELAND